MTNPIVPDSLRSKDRKPWHLHGKEAEIVWLKDVQGWSWEEIAADFGASKNGIMGAYRRGKDAAPLSVDSGAVLPPDFTPPTLEV